jgi:hypothetical protein
VSPARPPSGEELDRLLGEWSATSQLSQREAEAVRVAVVSTRPPGLDAGWWSGLVGQVSAAVIQATVLPDSALAALRPASPLGSPTPA